MRKKECFFDRHNIEFIDYTDSALLQRFLTNWARIKPSSETGTCSHHQRQLTRAIKQARYLAVLPYTSR